MGMLSDFANYSEKTAPNPSHNRGESGVFSPTSMRTDSCCPFFTVLGVFPRARRSRSLMGYRREARLRSVTKRRSDGIHREVHDDSWGQRLLGGSRTTDPRPTRYW